MVSSMAPSIIRPKFVAQDSSHLAVLIQDKHSADKQRRESAKGFEEIFNKSGCVLLLCWHHIEELLKHGDDTVVAERVAFIQSLPMLAWVTSYAADEIPGTIADILGHEAAAAFASPDARALAIRDQVAKNLFRIDSGQRAITPFVREWERLRPDFLAREERSRELVAISGSDFAGNSKTKMRDLLKGQLRSPKDTQEQLQGLNQRLVEDIRTRGDKKIPDAAQTAARFFDDVVQTAAAALSDGPDPALQILSAMDIDLSDIEDHTTLGDVGDLATFRRKLRIANRSMGLPWPDLKSRVKEDQLPSGVIQSALRQYGQDLPERKGSELTDSYLACLSAYADITYVDKRTHENFRRARRNCPVFAAVTRRVEKASHYREIAKHLEH
jgi:hypothetical protein